MHDTKNSAKIISSGIPQAMLELHGVTKTFHPNTPNERKALADIHLTLEEGKFLTVIGGNGAGKSTLLNVISGTQDVDTGSILLDGEDITRYSEYRRSRLIGRVFQDPMRGTAYDMTIAENLAIAYAKGSCHGLQRGIRKKDEAYFQDRLAALGLGLEKGLKQKVGLLSGGQRQAMTLLMATLVKPKLLLLDEHTAALDPVTARKVLALTKELAQEGGICTIMVTHNMKTALEHGSRTIMMHEGRIILDISGEERRTMTVDGLLEQFEKKQGEKPDSDRLLLG